MLTVRVQPLHQLSLSFHLGLEWKTSNQHNTAGHMTFMSVYSIILEPICIRVIHSAVNLTFVRRDPSDGSFTLYVATVMGK